MNLNLKKNMQKNLSLILANTKRSLYYLKELILRDITIDNILIYDRSKKSKLFKLAVNYKNKKKIYFIKSKNINTKNIEKKVNLFKSKYILYSGYSAEIIKSKKLLLKPLIHCHPGLLPKFRGSTVIYYSYIAEKKIYVSIFKMSKHIDKGKILFTKKFSPPKNLSMIENLYDNQIRSKALVSFILKKSKVSLTKRDTGNTSFYYIAHPIIRNILLNPIKILEKKI